MIKNLYEILGIEKSAKKTEIKKAYRDKSKICHPDQGGKQEDFHLVNTAYRILIDEEKRERYHKGESPEDILISAEQKEKKIFAILMELFCAAVIGADPKQTNIIKLIKDKLEGDAESLNRRIKEEKIKQEKFEIAIKRVKYTKEKNNIFKELALSQIEQSNINIGKIEKCKDDILAALKLLEGFSY